MVMQKVSIQAILRRADDVAKKACILRNTAIVALIKSHDKLGIEVDFGPSPDASGDGLDFTGKASRTAPQFHPRRQERPFQA